MSIIANTAVSFVMLSAITGAKIANNVTTYSQPVAKTASSVTTVVPTPPKVDAAITPPAPQPVIVVVQPGDTLSSIAEAHATDYARIFAANDSISDPNLITVGQQVRIPDPTEQVPARALPTASTASSTVTTAPVRQAAVTASVSIVGNDAKAYIYAHESGNNPNATSASGCYGLGQDCNGVVRSQCGADYACQDAYFTSYATRRYGSWEGAAAFWQANGWW